MKRELRLVGNVRQVGNRRLHAEGHLVHQESLAAVTSPPSLIKPVPMNMNDPQADAKNPASGEPRIVLNGPEIRDRVPTGIRPRRACSVERVILHYAEEAPQESAPAELARWSE
jgi:hypothetical protein